MARQYAKGYNEGSPRRILGKLGIPSDNVWAQQYVLAEAGVCHADLCMLFPCEECTYEKALLLDCNIVKRVLFMETFDCNFRVQL